MTGITWEEASRAYTAGVAQAFGVVAEIEAIKAKNMITPGEAIKIIPFTVGALQKMRENGTGPEYIKFGRRVYYSPQALLAFSLENRVLTDGPS